MLPDPDFTALRERESAIREALFVAAGLDPEDVDGCRRQLAKGEAHYHDNRFTLSDTFRGLLEPREEAWDTFALLPTMQLHGLLMPDEVDEAAAALSVVMAILREAQDRYTAQVLLAELWSACEDNPDAEDPDGRHS